MTMSGEPWTNKPEEELLEDLKFLPVQKVTANYNE